MKQIALLFLLLVAVMLGAYWLTIPGNTERLTIPNLSTATNNPSAQTPVIKVGKNEIKVEIAQNGTDRQVGLSKHTSLDKDSGMLFKFDKQNIKPSFWMKGMVFSIDIIWIKDKKVSQITPEIPTVRQGLSDQDIPQYTPNQPVDYVLEIPAGAAKLKNIQVGDPVEIP